MYRSIAILTFCLTLAEPAWAGPGHDHGAEANGAMSSPTVPRLESEGATLELVAFVEGQKLTIYLDDLHTNEPIEGAKIEVAADDLPPLVAEPSADGTYVLSGDWLTEPGTKTLTFLVTAGDQIDLLNGTLDILALGGVVPHEAASTALLEPATWLIAGVAALLGVLLAFAFRSRAEKKIQDARADRTPVRTDTMGRRRTRAAAESVLIFGLLITAVSTMAVAGAGPDHDHGEGNSRVKADGNVPAKMPNSTVFLPKPSQRLLKIRTAVASSSAVPISSELLGMVIAEPASEGRVQAPMDGAVEFSNGSVPFIGEEVKVGDVLGSLTPAMPVYERGYLEQLTAEVDGKLQIAEQRLRRLKGVSNAFVAQKDIEDTLAELAALREQKRVLEPKSAQKIELKAPVSGIISVSNVRAGQVVNSRDTLFEIVDPNRLWVEAVGVAGQDYTTIAGAHAIYDEGQSLPIRLVGSAPTLRHQMRPLFFEISAPDPALAIGTRVRVLIQTGTPVAGVVLPEAAIVRNTNGLSQTWVKVGAELFKPETVTTEPIGGGKVLVTAGLKEGSRVVVNGAELINQVR